MGCINHLQIWGSLWFIIRFTTLFQIMFFGPPLKQCNPQKDRWSMSVLVGSLCSLLNLFTYVYILPVNCTFFIEKSSSIVKSSFLLRTNHIYVALLCFTYWCFLPGFVLDDLLALETPLIVGTPASGPSTTSMSWRKLHENHQFFVVICCNNITTVMFSFWTYWHLVHQFLWHWKSQLLWQKNFWAKWQESEISKTYSRSGRRTEARAICK